MSQEINFLSHNKTVIAVRNKDDKRSFFFIIIFTAIVALIFIALLIYENYNQQKLTNIANQQAAIEEQILAGDQQEREYLSFYSKLQKTNELITKQSSGTQKLIDIYRYFTTEDTAIISCTYDYYITNIELSLNCNSVFSLQKLINLIQAEEFRQQYQRVTMTSLSRSSSGTYNITVDLEL